MENSDKGTFSVVISQRQQSFPNMQACWIKSDGTFERCSEEDCQTGLQLEIQTCCQESEDGVLLRKFSRNSSSITSLLETTAANKQLYKLFWAYLGKRYTRVAELLQSNVIPVYLRKSNEQKLLPVHQLQVCPTPVEAVYHFGLTDEGITYRFELSDNRKKISPHDYKYFLALTPQPCVFVLEKTLFLSERTSSKALEVMTKKGQICIPSDKTDLYMNTFVKKVLETEDIDCKGFTVNTYYSELKAKLTTTADVFGNKALSLTFCYGNLTFTSYSQKAHMVELRNENGQYVFDVFKRDFKREKELTDLLGKHNVTSNANYLYLNDNNKTLEDLLSAPEIVQNFEIDNEYLLHFDFEEKIDWFDVKIVVEVQGFKIPFHKFRNHIKNRHSTFILPDGSRFHIPEEWFSLYSDLFNKAEDHGDSMKLSKRYAGLIADQCSEARNYIMQMEKVDTKTSDRIKAKLRPYQEKGFNFLLHLYQQGYGGCLADDMGLGKTLQVIAFFVHLYSNGQRVQTTNSTPSTWQYSSKEPTLFDQVLDAEPQPAATPAQEKKPASIVVVPTTVLFNWENELQKFAPFLRYTKFYGNKRIGNINEHTFNNYHLVLTTYSMLTRDADILCNYPFECAVLDESHYIKNPQSQSYKSAIRLQAKNRFVLTGTPVENSLSDLWSQISFACPGLLGNYTSFCETYTPTAFKRLEVLKNIVKPFILRRTKKEVCPELPELTKIDVWCEMEEREQKVYETEKSAVRNAIMHIGKIDLNIFRQLTRLRQIACDPTILPEYAHLDAIKRKWVVEWAKELHMGKNKVLMFSAFVSQLNLIAKDLTEQGIPFGILTGDLRGEERQKVVERFQNDAEQSCLLVSLKAGGTGINLTAANYVFLLSPWWNPFAEQQAVDRAYRIGQKNNVTIYNFITKGTVEEKIIQLQEKKRKLAGSVISSGDPLQHLTINDLEELV